MEKVYCSNCNHYKCRDMGDGDYNVYCKSPKNVKEIKYSDFYSHGIRKTIGNPRVINKNNNCEYHELKISIYDRFFNWYWRLCSPE